MLPMQIFYDGECPLCKKEITFLKKRDKHNLLQMVDISVPEFNPSIVGKTKQELMARIHGKVGPEVIEGVEVFRQAYSRVGLGWVLASTKLPFLKQVADVCYMIFAKYRIRIGRSFGRCDNGKCGLK